MNKLFKTIAALVVGIGLSIPAMAAVPGNPVVPWGAIAVPTSTASPVANSYVCPSFASDPVCIINMTSNVASLTVSGTPSTPGGAYATIIFQQDGTGSRTLALPTNITTSTSIPTLPAIPSAANTFTVWVLQKVGSNYQVVGTYDNLNLSGTFITTQTSNGTAVAPGAAQVQPTVVVPGMTASSTCSCQAQTLPATWLSGIVLSCLPETNAVQCVEINPNGSATITPTVNTLNISWPSGF